MAKAYSEYDQNDITELEDEQKAKVEEKENFYDTAIEETKQFYSDQSAALETWGKEQEKIQQAQTDLTIEGLEKAKEEAEDDYQKEQSAAYVDYKEQTDPHGVAAEQMASMGMTGSGYSESSRVAMYTAYQNRVAVNREAFKRTEAEFDLAIKDAELKNSSALADIHYKTLTEKLYLQMEGFSAKNELLMEKADAIDSINADYEARIQYILESIAERKAAEEKAAAEKAQLNPTEDASDLNVDEDDSSGLASLLNSVQTKSHTTLPMQEIAKLKEDKTFNHPSLNAMNLPGGTPSAAENLTLEEIGLAIANNGKLKKPGVRDEIPITERMKEKDTEKNGTYTNSVNPLLNSRSVNQIASEVAKNAKKVNTDYYKGPINYDAHVYGTFANGYQPKGISGHGTLTKSGKTYTFHTTTLSGETKYVTQNVWKAEDGSLWYWEGRQNEYLPYHLGYRRSS